MDLPPHPFSLRQLQYIVAIADHLSFRKAAEVCHVSQPALSAQVAQVEELLGVQIFERDRRRVLTTPAGTIVVERARRVLVEANDLADAARRAGDPLTAALRLGVIPTIAPYLLPSLTPVLRERFPTLTPLWTEEKTPVLAERLADGVLDAALLALEADIGEVEHEVVGRDPFVLAVPEDHPLAATTGPLPPTALIGLSLLLLDEGHCFRTQTLGYCAQTGAHEMAFRATSLGTLTQMVSSGAGLTLLPRIAVPTEVGRSRIRVLDLADAAAHRTVALVWRPRSPLGPSLRVLGRVMREACREPAVH